MKDKITTGEWEMKIKLCKSCRDKLFWDCLFCKRAVRYRYNNCPRCGKEKSQ